MDFHFNISLLFNDKSMLLLEGFFEHCALRIAFSPCIVNIPYCHGSICSIFDKSSLVVITNYFHFLLVTMCNKLRK